MAAPPAGRTLEALAAASPDECYRLLGSSPQGLTAEEAARRLQAMGRNEIETGSRSLPEVALSQARSGINLLLALAGVLTAVTGDVVDGLIILALIVVNLGLGTLQEYRAELALAALRAMLPLKARVRRDGTTVTVPLSELVEGDVVLLRSGDVVPADVRIVESDELEVDQASLTGESVPVAKSPLPAPAGQGEARASPAAWADIAFAGTDVVGGEGTGLVVATGARTQFGETASLVKGMRAPGDFQSNLTRFGSFLLRFGLLFAGVVFLSNALLGRGVLVSAALALAVALGVVPEALPAVTATTLALGAHRLARKKVLVRRLAAVEDLSAVDTLCIDKTGTITEARTAVTEVWTLAPPAQVLEAAVMASSFPARGSSAIDDAVIAAAESQVDLAALEGRGRTLVTRFSSETKRTCVRVTGESGAGTVCKGAAGVIVDLCSAIRTAAGDDPIGARRGEVLSAIERLQASGARVLGVAAGADGGGDGAPETGMALLGLVALSDPPRPAAAAALKDAEAMGVEVKIVTGDAVERAEALARQVHLDPRRGEVLPGAALRGGGVARHAERGVVFAGVVPADKHRLVQVLQGLGRHVAVTGDGVNDTPALETADVGIALASGTDAARGAADMVLLDDDLAVIVDSIREGRRTFVNINRYLLYTMVSNFANVIIVAVASLFLSYLPLLPAQVLLLNVLADVPMLAIVTDSVSRDDTATPRRWDIRHLVELSLFMGLANMLFAFALLRIAHEADPRSVRTAWFLFLGSTALFVLFAVRSRGWAWERPWPSRPMLLSLGGVFAVTLALVNVPLARRWLGFTELGWQAQLGIEAFSVLYLLVADLMRRAFEAYVPASPGRPGGGPRRRGGGEVPHRASPAGLASAVATRPRAGDEHRTPR